MATERKRRRSTAPQRSPGALADTLAQMAAATADPPPRRPPRFTLDQSLFAPASEPAAPRRAAEPRPPRRSARTQKPSPAPTQPESAAALEPTEPKPPAPREPSPAPGEAKPAAPREPSIDARRNPPDPVARASLVSDGVSGSSVRELSSRRISTTPVSPPPASDPPARRPARPRAPRRVDTRDAARAAAAQDAVRAAVAQDASARDAPPAQRETPPAQRETPPEPPEAPPAAEARATVPPPEASSPATPPQDAAGGLAIGNRLAAGSGSPRTERKPISRISGRSSSGRAGSGRSSAGRSSAGRSSSGRSSFGGRLSRRSGDLATAQAAGSRFSSRASGRVGRRGSRTTSRRPHARRRFTLVVLAVVALILFVIVLIGGSSNKGSTPAGARPATVPVPVPVDSIQPAPPAAPAPAATTTPARSPPDHAHRDRHHESQGCRPGQAQGAAQDPPEAQAGRSQASVHRRRSLPAVHHHCCAGARQPEPRASLHPAPAGPAVVDRRRLPVWRDQVTASPPGAASQELTQRDTGRRAPRETSLSCARRPARASGRVSRAGSR